MALVDPAMLAVLDARRVERDREALIQQTLASLGWTDVRIDELDWRRERRFTFGCSRCQAWCRVEVNPLEDMDEDGLRHTCPVLVAEQDGQAYWGELLEVGPGMVA